MTVDDIRDPEGLRDPEEYEPGLDPVVAPEEYAPDADVLVASLETNEADAAEQSVEVPEIVGDEPDPATAEDAPEY